MKRTLSFAVLFLVLTVSAAKAESCSCSAPDGSCSASISCSAGCVAICGSGGSCTAQCSSSGPGHTPFIKGASTIPGRSAAGSEPLTSRALPKSVGSQLLNIDLRSATAEEISNQMSAAARIPIRFVPAPGEETLSLQLKGFPLDELLSALAKRGAVVIDGRDYERTPAKTRTGGDDRRVTFEAHQVDATGLSQMLSGILGQEVEVRVQPGARFDLQAKDISIDELLGYVSLVGEVVPRD